MLALGIAKAETEREKARINVTDTMDRISSADGNMSELSGEAIESHLREWDAKIDHLEALTDLLLLNLEDGCYSLLNGLRGKEKHVRDALKDVRMMGRRGCPSTENSKITGSSIADFQERTGCLPAAVEELTMALDKADQQLSQIYSDLGDQYLPRPSSFPGPNTLRTLGAERR